LKGCFLQPFTDKINLFTDFSFGYQNMVAIFAAVFGNLLPNIKPKFVIVV